MAELAERPTCLLVGGLVAMGFDAAGRYLLVVSHSGRGVYEVGSWVRVARDTDVHYPTDGRIGGIGPLAGTEIAVTARDDRTGSILLRTADGRFAVLGESDGITIRRAAVNPPPGTTRSP